jgi:excisionase family DNA binding protein
MSAEQETTKRKRARPVINGELAITADEAALVIGCERGWVYDAAQRGELPHYRPMPRKLWFLRSQLEAWLAARHVAPLE